MSKKLKVGMVGGAADSFMGKIHRAAIEATGSLELVCGAFGASRQSSFDAGKILEMPTERVYGTYRDMFRREAALPVEERMDFVTVIPPNTMHYPVAMSSIDAGFPMFCEKPFTSNLDEAVNLSRKQRESGLPYAIAMVYAAYPMLRKARELITVDKELGNLRKVVVNYLLGWMAPRLENAGNKHAGWRTDPRRCGGGGALIDLAIHCQYLSEWVTGLEITDLTADLRPSVPGRILDDDCTILARFGDNVHGVLMASQITTGRTDGISLEIIGDKAALLWVQNQPDKLILRDVSGKETILTGGTPAKKAETHQVPFGNDTAYLAALTDSYRDYIAYLLSVRAGKPKLPAIPNFMTIQEGLRSVAFVDAVLKNTAIPEEDEAPPAKWHPLIVPPVPDL